MERRERENNKYTFHRKHIKKFAGKAKVITIIVKSSQICRFSVNHNARIYLFLFSYLLKKYETAEV